MPDHREFQNNENLEDAMWRLKVDDSNNNNNNNNNQEGLDGHQNPYPDRPGAPDCIYYLRTGVCGYGSNCRYNHPTYNGQGFQERGELPERVGQPECQYYLKTGTCKFGETCKYHHPRDRNDIRPAPLNFLGLPMRQDEKSCPYYMRTGSCKFGFACKFNHPQPATMGPVYPLTAPSTYGSTVTSVAPPSIPLVGGLSAWPSARPYLPSPRMQSLPAYMPMVLPSSQGAMPMQQGWSTYMGSIGQIPSTEVLGPAQIPNAMLHGQSGSSTTINLPERLDQPECQYYMKNGTCKYGPTCKYHHPKERYSESPFTLGPLGLPLRPGHAICSYYSVYGSCRYGAACKFDHPLMGYYNYAVPTLPVSDPSALYPLNPRNLPQVTRASPTQAPKLPERFKRSGETSNTDSKESFDINHEHVDDPAQAHTTSPSTNTEPSDSRQKHSD